MCDFFSKSSQVLIRSRILRENGKYIPKQVGCLKSVAKLSENSSVFVFTCMCSDYISDDLCFSPF